MHPYILNISSRIWPHWHRLKLQISSQQPYRLPEPSWLSVRAIFLRASGVKGPRGWPARRTEGSENKDTQVGMSSFSLSQNVPSPHRFRSTRCLRQEKGRKERCFYCVRRLLICLSTASQGSGVINPPAVVLSVPGHRQLAQGELSIFKGPRQKPCTKALLTRCWRAHPGISEGRLRLGTE